MSNYCPNCGFMYCECRTFQNFCRDLPFTRRSWDLSKKAVPDIEIASDVEDFPAYVRVVRNGIASLLGEEFYTKPSDEVLDIFDLYQKCDLLFIGPDPLYPDLFRCFGYPNECDECEVTKKTLNLENIIPAKAIIMDALTTQSGITVTPIWYFGTDGHIDFRDKSFVLDIAKPSRIIHGNGLFAENKEEAWEKSRVWAAEN
jgi:hypothetical protein